MVSLKQPFPRGAIFISASFLLLPNGAPSAAAEGTFNVLEPIQVAGDHGAQTVKEFNLDHDGEWFLLEFHNGGAPNGAERPAGRPVTDLALRLNGVDVFVPGEFVRQTAYVARPVRLKRENRIEIRAWGEEGSQATVTIRGTDRVPPDILFVNPAPDAFVGGALSQIELGLGDDRSGVEPSSLSVKIDDEGLEDCGPTPTGFACLIGNLAEGDHRLWTQVADRAGNVARREIVFRVDRLSPLVRIESPPPKSVVKETRVAIKGRVLDARANIAGVRINGQESIFRKGEFSLDGLPLKEGANTIQAVPIDSTGSALRPYLTEVTLDSVAPEIELSLPKPVVHTSERVQFFSGSVTDRHAVELWINDTPVNLHDETFRLKITLADGDNEFHFVARDSAGNRSETIRTVILDSNSPEPFVGPEPPALDPSIRVGAAQTAPSLPDAAGPQPSVSSRINVKSAK